MTMRDVVHDTDVVAGTLSINFVPSKVLINSRATKSFISRKFVQELHCQTRLLDEALTIGIANQDRVSVNHICPRSGINILGHRLYDNLIPFKLREFDVILRMYWLSEYDAQIDCKSKKVMLRASENVKVMF